MKKKITILFLGLLLASCAPKEKPSDKPVVITSLFPQFDFVRAIAHDKVDVSLLLPPGVEPHSFDPTPSQVIAINKADLFIYTNDEMEPWITQLTQHIKGDTPIILDSSQRIELLADHFHDDHDHDHDHDHLHDPHVWLDPLNAKIMVENIMEALIAIDQDNAAFYQDNAQVYLQQLDALNEAYETMFNDASLHTIIYGGHFAFGYLMDRFNITILSPYTGFSPDAEPTAKAISQLIETIEKEDIAIIFYEELIEPRIANIISEQTNTKAMLLHGAHNITKEEMEANVTYLSIMNDNVEKLKEALHR